MRSLMERAWLSMGSLQSFYRMMSADLKLPDSIHMCKGVMSTFFPLKVFRNGISKKPSFITSYSFEAANSLALATSDSITL
jgi:hypothetical protein